MSVDDEGGARALARHLLELGRRSFGRITWLLKEVGCEGIASVERQRHAVYPPPLTTVAQPLLDKGLAAAWMLMEGWEGEPPVVNLATKLIARGSTGPVF